MNAESSGTSEYKRTSIHPHEYAKENGTRCKPKQQLNCVSFGSVGSATDFNTKGTEFDLALGMGNTF